MEGQLYPYGEMSGPGQSGRAPPRGGSGATQVGTRTGRAGAQGKHRQGETTPRGKHRGNTEESLATGETRPQGNTEETRPRGKHGHRGNTPQGNTEKTRKICDRRIGPRSTLPTIAHRASRGRKRVRARDTTRRLTPAPFVCSRSSLRRLAAERRGRRLHPRGQVTDLVAA